jgi:uncharacterized protein (TIGR02996 family)
MAVRTFEFDDGKSRKFWNIDLQGQQFTVTYGRRGTPGQSQTKKFADATKAQAEHDKLIKEKLGKGYVETTAGAAAPPTVKALENALVADPDDLGAHAAYADFLTEQGDPRGEFIQVQLALEDPARTAKERQQLQKREKELLKAHEREWLGDLAPTRRRRHVPHNTRGAPVPYQFRFARGWLDSLRIPEEMFGGCRLSDALQLRLLRRLVIEGQAYEDDDRVLEQLDERDYEDEPDSSVEYLTESPYLTNVRVFQLGELVDEEAENVYYTCRTNGSEVVPLVKKMPRLEELYLLAHGVDMEALFSLKTLDHLRVLQVYHMEREYPLSVLARNPHLGQLTDLLLHPHGLGLNEPEAGAYLHLAEVRALLRSRHLRSLRHLRLHLCNMGDAGCQELVRSGILKRLRILDLQHGCITDEGAQTLAACPDLAHLEVLDLGRNWLTDEGIQNLRAVVPSLRADRQYYPEDEDNVEYLYEGDCE